MALNNVDGLYQIYAYLDNSLKQGTGGRQLKQDPTIKTRAYGHDKWRQENNEISEAAINQWREEHKVDLNFGKARSVSSKLFKQLAALEQKKYKDMARVQLTARNGDLMITDQTEYAQ